MYPTVYTEIITLYAILLLWIIKLNMIKQCTLITAPLVWTLSAHTVVDTTVIDTGNSNSPDFNISQVILKLLL